MNKDTEGCSHALNLPAAVKSEKEQKQEEETSLINFTYKDLEVDLRYLNKDNKQLGQPL